MALAMLPHPTTPIAFPSDFRFFLGAGLVPAARSEGEEGGWVCCWRFKDIGLLAVDPRADVVYKPWAYVQEYALWVVYSGPTRDDLVSVRFPGRLFRAWSDSRGRRQSEQDEEVD